MVHPSVALQEGAARGAKASQATRPGYSPASSAPSAPPMELQPVDPRVLHSLQRLREAGEGVPDRDALARAAHLSASRFNHLFSDELGVSFRSYRIWTHPPACCGRCAR